MTDRQGPVRNAFPAYMYGPCANCHSRHSAAPANGTVIALERAIVSAATSPYRPIVLARWRQDRRAGNGILIEGSPPGEIHHAFIRLVDSQAGDLLDVTSQTGVRDALFPRLEWTDNAAAHENVAGVADSVVHALDENLTIRAA
jgi:hypothetical protein